VAPLRQPVLLAKEIASMQLLSEGRFKLGVGPGWYEKEFEAVGHNIRERGRRTDEIIESLQLLFGQETASFHGRHYKFDDITMVPRVKMPELWISGGSRVPDPNEHDLPVMAETVKRRIVKAGKWLARASGTFEWMERDWAELRAHAKEVGKDPDSLEFGMCNFFHLVDAKTTEDALALQAPKFERVMGTHRSIDWLQKGYLLGTTSQIVDRLQRAASVGCSYFILGPTMADPEQIDKLAKDVAPHLT
jgi:alkanesulfonate monooxygenase SsuD/methylene tetrahydromethanopterin reductase-like flavin-dependent oxidoreductase (luciferase family)